jgi:replicative DNA helicase
MNQASSDLRSEQLAPHSVEAEEAVLGSILINPDALFEILAFLRPEDFFIVRHSWIFSAMLSLHERRDPIDYLTLVSELEQTGKLAEVGGAAYILSLINKTPSALNVEGYGRIVERMGLRRKLIDAAGQIARVAHSEETDIDNVIGKAEQAIFDVTERRLTRDLVPIKDAVSEYFDHVSFLSRHQEEVMGVPTGFIDLDRMLGGMQRSDLIIVAARPGMGKCLGKGTLVLMYSGDIKPVEAVQVGDLVMGPDSQPRRVLALGRGREMMYWIRQNHGDDYRVNASHILSLKRSKNEGNHQHGEVMNISVTDAFAQLANIQSRWKGYKVSVDFPEQPVPIDPYVLGVWLGDGTTANSSITVADLEIKGALEACANLRNERLVAQHSNAVKTPVYRITAGTAATGRNSDGSYKSTSMQSQLRELGVLGRKHIPACYLRNSREVRLQVLAGIIDTDGSLEFNCYVVTLKSETLARDLVYLARSLGLGASIRSCIKSCTNSTVPNHRDTYFRVDIVGHTDMVPVRLSRKQASPRRQIKDPLVTGIMIEPDCVDDYYGFELDGDGLFLLGDFTVTHNTSWLNSVVMNAARMNQRTAIFSLEMSNEQMIQRFVSAETNIPSGKLREGKLDEKDWAQFLAATQYMGTLPIYMDDTPALSTSELRTKARRLHLEYGLDLIVIDYLQLMTTPYKSENRVQEISYISRALKQLARELNCPVVSAAQLSRAVEQRTDKRPQLSDLRESGSIEQDSDVVMFIYRDAYYNPDSPQGNIAEIHVGKHRHGPTGTVELIFIPALTQFQNAARHSIDLDQL